MGRLLLDESDRMFKLWHAFKRGEMDRAALAAAMEPVKEAWGDACAQATESPDRKLAALGADLWNQWDAPWTFVDLEGMEPTNHVAARTLRPAVLWRKCSFGTNSDAGSLFVSRMLTATQTARRRGVHLLDWLQQAYAASTTGLAPPPLVVG